MGNYQGSDYLLNTSNETVLKHNFYSVRVIW